MVSGSADAQPARQPAGAVVVLGDLARSPRMRAHALALAAAGWRVRLIGYVEEERAADLCDHPAITVVPLADPLGARARAAHGIPRLALNALRLVGLAVRLARALLAAPDLDAVLVQNPPSLPTLGVARAVCAWTGARLVVDWHNFGRDMLALRLGRSSPLVRLAGLCERLFARGASAHLCVTAAMQHTLAAEWQVPGARVLPDLPRAPGRSWPRSEARRRLGELITLDDPEAIVVITATSWTQDEAHDLLVEALDICAARRSAGSRTVTVMTGRGPGRAAFAESLAERPAGAPRVELTWVEPEDYRALLAGADVGVSLHASASGVDFPMKIVDMKAAGLPVLALDYGPALHEGLAVGREGFAFHTSAELADLLDQLAGDAQARSAARAAIASARGATWNEAWTAAALPALAGSR